MYIRKRQPNPLGLLLAASVVLGGSALAISAAPAQADEIFQQQGELRPMQQEYTFSGRAGQAVTISLTSPDFDTLVVLVDPSGSELATNDDYARSLNSTIVITLPSSGTYKVLARSFSGQGGNYTVTVKPATAFDQAYFNASNLYREGNLDEALTALNEAIRVDPNQPYPYLDRGDIYYSQGNLDAVRSDYEHAADLYEQAGDREMAQMLREQLTYLDNPPETAPTP